MLFVMNLSKGLFIQFSLSHRNSLLTSSLRPWADHNLNISFTTWASCTPYAIKLFLTKILIVYMFYIKC